MDISWVKPHLDKLFGGCPSNQAIKDLIKEKISRFNGKLYKYYAFSQDDENYSLNNLENGVFYFSKPDRFNDPFDCALGFSIDDALKSMLPQFLNRQINLEGENADLIKEFILDLLCGNTLQVTYDNPTLEAIALLYSNPKMSSIFQRALRGEQIDDAELQKNLLEALTVEGFAAKFFSLITDPSKVDGTTITKNDAFKACLSLMKQSPDIIKSSGQTLDAKAENLVSAISSISKEESIIDRIDKLAEVTDYKGIDIKAEVKKVREALIPILPKIKSIINNTFAITCFSETPDNILMWAHYGDKHTGFCVEYDFSKMKTEKLLLMLFPVVYSASKPTVPLSLFDFDDLKNIKLSSNMAGISDLIISLLTKSDIWKYENEWRIIGYQSDLNKQTWQEDIAVKVYYGVNISPENKKKLDEIVERKKIESAQFILDNDKFKLKVV